MKLNLTLALSACLAGMLSTVSGTDIKVQKGCILVDNQPVCAPGGSIIINGGKATIHARFDGGKTAMTDRYCVLNAEWPDWFGDIYYAKNDCLTDAHGTYIPGQCCRDIITGPPVRNPYA